MIKKNINNSSLKVILFAQDEMMTSKQRHFTRVMRRLALYKCKEHGGYGKTEDDGIMPARHAKVIPVAGVYLISQSAPFADFPAVMKNCACACSIS